MTSRVAAVLVCVCLLAASRAAGQSLQVTPLPRDGQVLVSFRLSNAFTSEVQAAIHSGLTISFVYRIDLLRSSALWLDRTVASAEVTASVRYDNLTRRYHLTRGVDGRIEQAEAIENEADAQAWLTADFARLPLFSHTALEPNSEYYLRVRAHMTPRNASFVWPWDRHDVTGQTKFTFVQ